MKRKRGNKNRISPIIIGVVILVVLVISVVIYSYMKTPIKMGPTVSVFKEGQNCEISEFEKCWNPPKDPKDVYHPMFGPDICGLDDDKNKVIQYEYYCEGTCKKKKKIKEVCSSLASVTKPFCSNDKSSLCKYNGKCVEKDGSADCQIDCVKCGVNKECFLTSGNVPKCISLNSDEKECSAHFIQNKRVFDSCPISGKCEIDDGTCIVLLGLKACKGTCSIVA